MDISATDRAKRRISFWTWARVAMCLMTLVFSMIAGAMTDGPFAINTSDKFGLITTIALAAASLVLAPLFVLAVVGLQARNPSSAKVWTRPTWDTSLFSSNPMPWLHACAFICLAGSVGILIGGLFSWQPTAWAGLWAAILSLELLWSIHLCQRVYKKKFAIASVAGAGEDV